MKKNVSLRFAGQYLFRWAEIDSSAFFFCFCSLVFFSLRLTRSRVSSHALVNNELKLIWYTDELSFFSTFICLFMFLLCSIFNADYDSFIALLFVMILMRVHDVFDRVCINHENNSKKNQTVAVSIHLQIDVCITIALFLFDQITSTMYF